MTFTMLLLLALVILLIGVPVGAYLAAKLATMGRLRGEDAFWKQQQREYERQTREEKVNGNAK